MIAAIDRLLCRVGGHRWTGPFILQADTHRVVSRYCMRCDQTRHAVQDVWSDPVRRFALGSSVLISTPEDWALHVRDRARLRECGGAA